MSWCLLQESSVVTRLLAVLVGFMVDEQLSSVTAGKDDSSTKVTQGSYALASLSSSFSLRRRSFA